MKKQKFKILLILILQILLVAWSEAKDITISTQNFQAVAVGSVTSNNHYPYEPTKAVTLSSTNNQRWKEQVSQFPFPSELVKVIFVNGRYTAIGSQLDQSGFPQYGLIYSSTDGVNWREENTGLNNNPHSQLLSIIYANNKYLVTGRADDKALILTSVDGVTWSHTTLDNKMINNLIYVNGRYEAVGICDTLACTLTSNDGINWTFQANLSQANFYPTGIVYGNGKFIAYGIQWMGNEGYLVYTSNNNGATWAITGTGLSRSINIGKIIFNNGKFIAAGGNDKGPLTAISTDGVNWVEYRINSISGNAYLNGIIYVAGQYIAVGTSFNAANIHSALILTSKDGINWSQVDSNNLPNDYYKLSSIAVKELTK